MQTSLFNIGDKTSNPACFWERENLGLMKKWMRPF